MYGHHIESVSEAAVAAVLVLALPPEPQSRARPAESDESLSRSSNMTPVPLRPHESQNLDSECQPELWTENPNPIVARSQAACTPGESRARGRAAEQLASGAGHPIATVTA